MIFYHGSKQIVNKAYKLSNTLDIRIETLLNN